MADRTSDELIALEKKFWQTMIDGDTDTAVGLLAEPALMVSHHGAMQFDHAGYRKMAENEDYKLVKFELSKVNVLRPSDDVAILTYEVDQTTNEKGKDVRMHVSDSSTWIRRDGQWRCAMHTEAPMDAG